jgi:uncharacterized membrane protein
MMASTGDVDGVLLAAAAVVPPVGIAAGIVAGALGLTGVVLVVSQPFLTGTFCTLCLLSAAISITVAVLVTQEARTAMAAYRPALRDCR